MDIVLFQEKFGCLREIGAELPLGSGIDSGNGPTLCRSIVSQVDITRWNSRIVLSWLSHV